MLMVKGFVILDSLRRSLIRTTSHHLSLLTDLVTSDNAGCILVSNVLVIHNGILTTLHMKRLLTSATSLMNTAFGRLANMRRLLSKWLKKTVFEALIRSRLRSQSRQSLSLICLHNAIGW